MSIKIKRAALIAAVALSACSGQDGDCIIPMTRDAVISATLGGVPVDLVLDTGSTGTVVCRDAVARLESKIVKLHANKPVFVDSQGAKQSLSEYLEDVTISIGNKCVTAPKIMLYPPRVNEQRDMIFVPPDGLLGLDFLLGQVLWIRSREVQVIERSSLEACLERVGRVIDQRIPLADIENGPKVRVRIEGIEDVQLLLDTGSARTSLPFGAARRLGMGSGEHLLKAERLDVVDAKGVVVGAYEAPAWDGSTQGWSGSRSGPRPIWHLKSLKIGNHEVQDVPVTEDERFPKLGRDVLGQIDWIWHGPSQEILILRSLR